MNNKLGEGNFGEVYRATLSSDLNSPRVKKYAETVRLLTKVKSPCFVAIKVLRCEYVLSTNYIHGASFKLSVLPAYHWYFLHTCIHYVSPISSTSCQLLVLLPTFSTSCLYHWYFLHTFTVSHLHLVLPAYHWYFLHMFTVSHLLLVLPADFWYFLCTFSTSCLLLVLLTCNCPGQMSKVRLHQTYHITL